MKKLLKMLFSFILVVTLCGCGDNPSSIKTEEITDPNLALVLGAIEGYIRNELKDTDMTYDITWDENADKKFVQVNYTMPGLTESIENLSWRINNKSTWDTYVELTESHSELFLDVLVDNELSEYYSVVTIRYEGDDNSYMIVSIDGVVRINYWDSFE